VAIRSIFHGQWVQHPTDTLTEGSIPERTPWTIASLHNCAISIIFSWFLSAFLRKQNTWKSCGQGSKLCGGWSNSFQNMEWCLESVGGIVTGNISCDYERIFSRNGATKVSECSRIVLRGNGDVRILNVWVTAHWSYVDMGCQCLAVVLFLFAPKCLLFWMDHDPNADVSCQQTHGHLHLAVFTSSTMSGFHLNNLQAGKRCLP